MKETLQIGSGRIGELWRFDHGYSSNAHTHEELEVNLCTSGRATYLVREEKVVLSRGSMLWLYPEEEHVLLQKSDNFSMWIGVFRDEAISHFSQHQAGRMLSLRAPSSVQLRKLPLPATTNLDVLFETLYRSKHDPVAFNFGVLFTLITAWETFAHADEPSSRQKVHPAVRQAVLTLKQDLSLSGEGLASRVGLSTSHLSRLFGEQLGVSIVQYRQERLVERVLELSRLHPDASLATLAQDAGFGSYAQFYRVFTKHYGRTPAWFLANRAQTDTGASPEP